MNKTTLHPDVHAEHVHVRVVDVQRSLEFYKNVLGFQILCDNRSFGLPIVFLWDQQYTVVLDASETPVAAPPLRSEQSSRDASFHHLAIAHSNSHELVKTVTQLVEYAAPTSVFLKDPDGNELELYYDRPRNEWFNDVGKPIRH
jgi:catechol 2,3-dioxygenase